MASPSSPPTKISAANRATAKKPVLIEVRLEETKTPERHELASDKDWAIFAEDVLEVKAKDGTHYYPLAQVRKWTVTTLEKETANHE